MTEELEPCPFCKNEEGQHIDSLRVLQEYEEGYNWYVYCRHCGARGPVYVNGKWTTSRASAVEAWNAWKVK